jgi:hypothetical protein
VALAVSTGIIIYLETLDTQTRIQNQVSTELARQRNAPASVSPSTQAAIKANLLAAQSAYATNPGVANNRAALLLSVSSAVQLGILRPEDGFAQAQKVLDEIERRPGEPGPVLASALGVAALAFPTLQDRIAKLNAGA